MSNDILKTRRSVRDFTDEIVSKEIIHTIIDSARFAPSWKNTQIARYTIVQNQEIIQRICDDGVYNFIRNSSTLKEAKQICIISYKKGLSGMIDGQYATSTTDWDVFDTGIATLQFCLAAKEQGIGTVIMGVINEGKIEELIDLPEDEVVRTVVVFGYAKHDDIKAPRRKEVDELVRFID